MRIVHIIQRYPPAVGGSEQWCREVSQYLTAAGDEVKVLTLDVLSEEDYWRDPPVDTTIRRLGTVDWDGPVQVRRFRPSPSRPLIRAVEQLLRRRLGINVGGPHSLELYARMFREIRRADVVHLHTLPYSHNYVALLAAKLFGTRTVITPHFHPGHPDYEVPSNYWLLRRCDVVFTDSAHERDYLAGRGIDPSRLVVAAVGIHPEAYAARDVDGLAADLRRRYGLEPTTRIVLFLGRKAGYKDLPTLVEAVRRARARHDVVLVLAGPSTDAFASFWSYLSEDDKRIILDVGEVSHAMKVGLLHLADVLVQPSPFEAFGIVFLEAWACGTPVIGSTAPAVAELVDGAGLTFESQNVDDLVGKLDQMLGDRTLAENLARRGRDKVLTRYQWSHVGAAVRRAYGNGTSRLRILLCSNLFPPHAVGGSEMVAYKQGSALRQLGHEVHVFAGQLGPARRRYRVRTEQGEFPTTRISITPEDLGGHTQRLVNTQAAAAFRRVLDDFRPDIVHFHNVTGLSIALIAACRERRVPTVMTLHDYWGICFKNLMIKNDGSLCHRSGFECLGCAEVLSGSPPLPSPVRNGHILLALLMIDRYISPSRYLAEQFVANGLPSERMHVIPNGIDIDRYDPTPRRETERPFTIGYIGQLIKHKGIEVLLRSLRLVGSEAQVIVVGDGEQGMYFRNLASELGLDRRVSFIGKVDNRRIAELHQTLDVVVVPSIWPENSPVVITEAMASGLPVVASAIGGIPELVEDGVTGFLVPPRDPRVLADRIEYLRRHPEDRRHMGEKAAQRIRNHELGQQVGCLLEVYRAVVDAKREERADASPHVVLYHAANDWDFPLRDAIHQIASVDVGRRQRLVVCRVDLVDEQIMDQAALLMIPSANEASFHHACDALRRGLPIVVNEAAPELRDLCVASNAGLYYGSSEELQACLDLLLSDPTLRATLGANGQSFVTSAGT